jgi:hypothetical protein
VSRNCSMTSGGSRGVCGRRSSLIRVGGMSGWRHLDLRWCDGVWKGNWVRGRHIKYREIGIVLRDWVVCLNTSMFPGSFLCRLLSCGSGMIHRCLVFE